MRPLIGTLLMSLLVLAGSFRIASAQGPAGRWVLGLHGGGNLWVNDYNERKIAAGGEILLGYGLSKYISLGLAGGYDELKANQSPPAGGFQYTYLKIESFPVALRVSLHLNPDGRFSPFLYAGGGTTIFRRKDFAGAFVPDTKYKTSLYIPVGVGFEVKASRSVSFVFDAGYRITDDKVDLREFQSPDGYASVKAGLNFYFGTNDGDDNDDDGLTNGEERKLGTNPDVADTDGDGLTDGEEVKRYRTNPLSIDTDGDGLSDGDEVRKYKTSPTNSDTDGDRLTDGDEILRYNTDPLKLDTDGDILPDGDEVLKYKTDPWKSDTDGDGLSDWDEVNNYKTDPTKTDTDGDGLSDADEIKKFATNPLKIDTDGGGMNDGAEVKKGTNPMDPRDDQTDLRLEKGKSLVLEGVNFQSGSATLTLESEQTLEKAFRALVDNPDLKVQIVGYTDNVGGAAMNQQLSQRRAQAVLSWLVKKGIMSNRLSAVGRGEENPIAPNNTAMGRSKNRRIEFYVQN
jgi:outer membrane protein OmpA-like peptidoglycan-associated protein